MPPEQVGWPGPGQPDYQFKIPTAIPEGRVLVHNSMPAMRMLGDGGFRAWFADPDAARLVRCECGWAPEFAEHYTVSLWRPATGDDS